MELPSESATLELVAHYARARARLRPELGQATLVLPTNEYFPDHFDGSQAAATRLVERMQRHAHIADIPVRVSVDALATTDQSSCSSGACAPAQRSGQARLELTADGWVLQLSAAELTHPVTLTGSIARTLGLIFLEETRPDSAPLPQPLELYAECAAVLLGFGALLLEASHVYTKSCGGPRVTQLTFLSAPELALLTALFASEHRLSLKAALKASSLTQRTVLGQAHNLIRANPRLLEWTLRASPIEPVPAFALAEGKPLLLAGIMEKFALLRPKRPEPEDLVEWLNSNDADVKLLAPRTPRSSVSKPDDELKALVAEALEPTNFR